MIQISDLGIASTGRGKSLASKEDWGRAGHLQNCFARRKCPERSGTPEKRGRGGAAADEEREAEREAAPRRTRRGNARRGSRVPSSSEMITATDEWMMGLSRSTSELNRLSSLTRIYSREANMRNLLSRNQHGNTWCAIEF
jgi:hypothetical protein